VIKRKRLDNSVRKYIPLSTVEKNHTAIAERLGKVKGGQSESSWARTLGVPQQTLNQYCHGDSMSQDFLCLLARKEKVSLDWLLLGRGKRSA